MSITVNEGGVLYELDGVTSNKAGVLYSFDTVHSNEGGIFYEIFSSGQNVPTSLQWTYCNHYKEILSYDTNNRFIRYLNDSDGLQIDVWGAGRNTFCGCMDGVCDKDNGTVYSSDFNISKKTNVRIELDLTDSNCDDFSVKTYTVAIRSTDGTVITSMYSNPSITSETFPILETSLESGDYYITVTAKGSGQTSGMITFKLYITFS